MEDADLKAMEILEDELLHPAVIDQAVNQATADVTASPEVTAARLAGVVERRRELTTIIGRLTAAIGAGGELAPLVTEMKAREQERQRVDAERRDLEAVLRGEHRTVDQVRRDLHQRAEDWRTAARRNVAQARQVLRKLLRGRLLITPREDGMCEMSGQADYGKLFSGILILRAVASAVASPTGSVKTYFELPLVGDTHLAA